MTFGETFVPEIMLSMSSDTLGSSASREWTAVDYGPSRSSTPDSSASSRLAAQLERSAYRRSRSNTRRRQNSSNNNVDARKPSRNKRSKNQQSQRSSIHVQDDMANKNGSLFEGSQKSSPRRKFVSGDDDKQVIAGNSAMNNLRLVNGNSHKEHRNFNKAEDDTIVTAYPVSTYSVSCVTVEEDNHNVHALSYTSEGFSQESNKDIVLNRKGQSIGGLVNDTYTERRHNGFPASDKPSGRTTSDCHFDKRSPTVGVSKVRFEESWQDTQKRPGYKARENPAVICSSREEKSPTKSKYSTSSDKVKIENNFPETIETAGQRRQNEEKRTNIAVNTTSDENDNGKMNEKKENTSYRKNNTTVKREVAENSRNEESKPLKLRQLIKIHEVQIAEVAKSAASMKKPSQNFQEGRLVKVKVVPEIENKQARMKLHAAKVAVPRNNTSFESSDNTAVPAQLSQPQRNDVSFTVHDQEIRKNDILKSDETRIKPKRHTVEMRSRKPTVEDQKWKRHTAIGLVGFDQPEGRERAEVSGWSPTTKTSFTNDSDLDVGYMRKQQVEPEMQIVNEVVKRCDVVDGKSRMSEVNKTAIFLYENNETKQNNSEENEVPPERPPLPENFYSSTEEIQQRPPPPILDDVVTPPPILQETSPLGNDILKPVAVNQPQCDVTFPRSLPAVHISTSAVIEVRSQEANVAQSLNMNEERDTVLGNSRTTREMYEERLAMINLVPLDKPNGVRRNLEVISSPCTSLESFVLENNMNLNKNAYLEKLKTSLKQVKLLAKEKEELEKKFELELRDWKRKYEEQHKVANAYQKLEDRYRRRVEELQTALLQCTCVNGERTKITFLGQPGKRTEPYFFNTQTQSILDETEEWLKEQSLRSENIHNTENLSNNTRGQNGNSLHGSSDLTGGTDWALNYKDIDVTTDIDQYNGTSV